MLILSGPRRGVVALLVLAFMPIASGTGGTRAATFPLALAAQGPPAAPPAGSGATNGAAANTPIQEGLASIRGLLFRADETTRIKGATVTAINTRTGRRYVSNFTGENGAYEVKDLPAGTYDIAIDSDRIYVTDNLVDLAEKQRLYMSFALQPKGGAAAGPAGSAGGGTGTAQDSAAGKGQAKVTFTDPNAVPATQEPEKKKGFWKSAGGITIITVLVAGAVGAGISAQHN